MADYYDIVYSKIVDYRSQVDYLEKIIAKHRRGRTESILDVACGTGNYTFVFARRGYRTTGIDISDEMLRVAKEKAGRKTNPRFFKSDMRKIDLQAKYDVAVVLFGGFGYLLEQGEVGEFLAGVAKQLNKGGLLIFEFWQNSAIFPAAARPSGQKTWDRVEEDRRSIVRLNTSKYDAQTNILTMTFDFYVFNIKTKKLVDKFSETHLVKTYALSHIQALLERSDFKALAFYDGDLGKTKKDDLAKASFSTFRVLAVARPSRQDIWGPTKPIFQGTSLKGEHLETASPCSIYNRKA
jgi:ubiquinone/menaquinone biosynthesis C-methylase UbiE